MNWRCYIPFSLWRRSNTSNSQAKIASHHLARVIAQCFGFLDFKSCTFLGNGPRDFKTVGVKFWFSSKGATTLFAEGHVASARPKKKTIQLCNACKFLLSRWVNFNSQENHPRFKHLDNRSLNIGGSYGLILATKGIAFYGRNSLVHRSIAASRKGFCLYMV